MVKVAASSLESLNKSPLDLRDRVVVDVDPAHVRRVAVHRTVAATTRPTTRAASSNDLVDEAIKAPPTTTKAATTTTTASDPAAPNTIVFGIRDSGPGIPPEEQTRLFDPFAQIENSLARTHEGLGLGLTTAKRLIERMDGRITVESEPGKGSLFTVFVPMEIIDAPAAALAR